jgi:hypothetical protein
LTLESHETDFLREAVFLGIAAMIWISPLFRIEGGSPAKELLERICRCDRVGVQ